MKSGATESSFYYLSQYYKIPNNVEINRSLKDLLQSSKPIKILWAHDNCDQPQFLHLPEVVSQIDKIVCVSNWEREQYIKYNRAPEDKIVVIPNGVADFFVPKSPKSKTAIFFSAPHKGIVPLPKIWKQIVKQHPDAKLKVFSSMCLYENAKNDFENKQEFIEAIEELKTMSSVEYSTCIHREELLDHIQDAAFFIHPNVWEETFCVSLAEAMSCGCYPITSDIGAIPQTSFGRGKYIPMMGKNTPSGWEPSPKFINSFAQELSKAFDFFDKQPETFYAATKDLSKLTRDTYDWKKIAKMWEVLIESLQDKSTSTSKYYCMITTQRSQEYTEHAIKSFFKNSFFNPQDKFFLIDNDRTFEVSDDYKNITLVKNSEPKSFAENMNFILKLSLVDGADFVGLNNDIIFTKDWNKNLNDKDKISVPLCNQYVCDSYETLSLSPAMELKDYNDKEDELNKIAENATSKTYDFKNTLIPFYCFYLPFEVGSKVGLFDEEYGKGGGEDIDYRIRAKQLGFDTEINTKSYLLHFVGKSTWLGGETKEETEERNKKYYSHFSKKWGKENADKFLSVV